MESQIYNSDDEILICLARDEVAAFDYLYEKFFSKLYATAYKRLKNRTLTEEVVQELFISIWERRKELKINTTINAYLFSAIKYLIIW